VGTFVVGEGADRRTRGRVRSPVQRGVSAWGLPSSPALVSLSDEMQTQDAPVPPKTTVRFGAGCTCKGP